MLQIVAVAQFAKESKHRRILNTLQDVGQNRSVPVVLEEDTDSVLY